MHPGWGKRGTGTAMAKRKTTQQPLGDLHARMLADISTGRLAGGTRLIISDLAERYQTSTNPVREALRHLQGQGLVEFEANRGARVLRGDDHAIRDTFEILQLLEPYFVRWFAEFSTPEDRRNLAEIQVRMEQAEDQATLNRCDQQFHGLIAEIHFNKRAVALWESQRAALAAYAGHLPVSISRVRAVNREHRALLAAFDAQDAAAAVAEITAHIGNAGRHLYEQMRLQTVRSEGAQSSDF